MQEGAPSYGAGDCAAGSNSSLRGLVSPTNWYAESLFQYQTQKVVKIRDWKLGVLRFTLRSAIFFYITVYQIMYKANHLASETVKGVVGVQVQHPTQDDCDEFKDVLCPQDFIGMSRLPYCKQNNFSGTYQKFCRYWDATQLSQPTDEGVLLPTRWRTFSQIRGCVPSVKNNWECRGNLWKFVGVSGKPQAGSDMAKPIEDIFIADVERYKILFDHSAHSDAGVSAYSFEMSGDWLNCSNPDEKDDACKRQRMVEQRALCGGEDHLAHTAVPAKKKAFSALQRRAARANTSFGPPQPPTVRLDNINSAYALRWPAAGDVVALCEGDVFTLGQLLSAANIRLDDTETERTNQSYRATGFGLVVRILYSNVEPWMGLKVFPWTPLGPQMHYSYHVKKHATGSSKLRKVTAMDENGRNVEEFLGVSVITEQYGTILVWDTTHLLVILTTTLALLAVCNYILENIALRCMMRSAEYKRLIYHDARTPEQPQAEV